MKVSIFVYLVFSIWFTTGYAKESAEFAEKVIREHGLQSLEAKTLKSLLLNSFSLTRNIDDEDLDTTIGHNKAKGNKTPISFHPVSRQQCIDKVIKTGIIKPNTNFEKICGHKWMAPVPDENGSIENSTTCIDQFEFPNIPCEYPVVWVPSATAKKICNSMGKRLCNSHEWEDSCAGKGSSDNPYLFEVSGADQKATYNKRRSIHNSQREAVWSFGEKLNIRGTVDTRDYCAVYSKGNPEWNTYGEHYNEIGKSNICHSMGSDFLSCGTHTFPSGYKHQCRSMFGVYDLHGNLAEVVNYPFNESEIATNSGPSGHTERKGSFFVYRATKGNGVGRAYPDDCRVRQPFEHVKEITKDTQHSYYQEGFRCCTDIED